MPEIMEGGSSVQFLQRQITGLEVRLTHSEKAVVSLVGRTDNFIKRHTEVFVLAALIAGYFLGMALKG